MVPINLIYHAVASFPHDLALEQAVFDTLSSIVAGVAAALLDK